MEFPPEIVAQLPEKVRYTYRLRTALRQRKAWRTGRVERRGAKEKFNDEDLIRIYIEIEARAQLLTGGNVLKLLHLPRLRVIEQGAGPRRPNQSDRHRLRKQHSEGQREARAWRDITFMGRPHFKWSEIQRRIKARMDELKSSKELLFLKIM